MCAWWPPCARIPPRWAEFTTRYGGRGYTSAAGLLADPAVDAVVIATPHHLHTAAVEAAAQAGKHILLEKPMAPTLAECDRILAATAAARVTLMLGHTSQFAPAYRLAKTMLDAGELARWFLASAPCQNSGLNPIAGPGIWIAPPAAACG